MHSKVIFLLFSFVIVSCTGCSNSQEEAGRAGKQKDVSELTIGDLFDLLYSESSIGIDYHGDGYGQGAQEYLKMTKEDSDCGQSLYLTSNAKDREILLAVETAFYFPGNPYNKMVRAYVVKPGQKIPIGHSLLCYNEKEYELNRNIISAGFKE